MQEIQQQLIGLGFTEYEAVVYGILASRSPANASHIAKKAALSRSSVYTTLNTLIGKGLVGTTFHNGVKQFVVEGHGSIARLLESEKNAVQAKFEIFKKLQETSKLFTQTPALMPGIVFFEGQEGLKKIYLEMMRAAKKDDVLYLLRDEFIWRPEWKFVYETEWQARITRWKVEKNIATKLLINDSIEERSHASFYESKKGLVFKMMSKKYPLRDFGLYSIGDTVAILSIEHFNLVGIKITNKHIAENFVALFNTLWHKNNSPK